MVKRCFKRGPRKFYARVIRRGELFRRECGVRWRAMAPYDGFAGVVLGPRLRHRTWRDGEPRFKLGAVWVAGRRGSEMLFLKRNFYSEKRQPGYRIEATRRALQERMHPTDWSGIPF